MSLYTVHKSYGQQSCKQHSGNNDHHQKNCAYAPVTMFVGINGWASVRLWAWCDCDMTCRRTRPTTTSTAWAKTDVVQFALGSRWACVRARSCREIQKGQTTIRKAPTEHERLPHSRPTVIGHVRKGMDNKQEDPSRPWMTIDCDSLAAQQNPLFWVPSSASAMLDHCTKATGHEQAAEVPGRWLR